MPRRSTNLAEACAGRRYRGIRYSHSQTDFVHPRRSHQGARTCISVGAFAGACRPLETTLKSLENSLRIELTPQLLQVFPIRTGVTRLRPFTIFDDVRLAQVVTGRKGPEHRLDDG
jgi:hypothetical protein